MATKTKTATTGHCPICGGYNIKVTQATKTGMAGHRDDNETANYRLEKHIRDDVGGDCGGSELPPDSLE